MGTIILFTIVLLPLLLGVLSHLCSFLHQKKRLHNLSTFHQPLFLQPNNSHNTLCFHHCKSRINKVRSSMDEKGEEEKGMMVMMMRRKTISVQSIDGEDNNAQKQSPPMSPLKKCSSSRSNNCLCSPTTHIGSFRCRLHRHGGGPTKPNMRRGHSVGSNLSELAVPNKFSSTSTLSTSSLQTSASSSQMQ